MLQVAKAASQTDEAETRLVRLQAEFENYKAVHDGAGEAATVQDALEEEKRKAEDLQFRLEELEILQTEGNRSSQEVEESLKTLRTKIISLEEDNLEMKASRETAEKNLTEEKAKFSKIEKQLSSFQESTRENRELQDKISKLNKEFAQEHKRCENLEAEANKVFEVEEQLMVVNEELIIAKKKVDDLEVNYEREKKQKEELLKGQQFQDISVAEKIIQFENEVIQKDSRIMELTHEVEKVKQSMEEIKTKSISSASEMIEGKKMEMELRTMLEKSQNEATEKDQRAEKLEKTVKELQEEVKHVKTAEQRNVQMVQELEADVSRRIKDNSEMQTQLDQSTSESLKELQERREDVNRLAEKLKIQESDLVKIKNELECKNEDIQDANNKFSLSETNLTSMTEIKAGLEKEISSQKEATKHATAEVARLVAETDKKEVVMHELRQTVKDVSIEKETLEQKLIKVENEFRTEAELLKNSNEEAIAALNKNRKELEKALESKVKEIEVNQIKWDEIQKELKDEHESSINRMNKTLESKVGRVVELESKVQTLRAESVSKDSNSEGILHQVQQLEERLKTTEEIHEKQMNDVNLQIEEKKREFSNLATLKDKLEIQITELESTARKYEEAVIDIMDFKSKNEELKCEKTALELQLKELKTCSSDASEELIKLADEKERLTSLLDQTKGELSDSRQKQQKLQIEFDLYAKKVTEDEATKKTEHHTELNKLNLKLEGLEKDKVDEVEKQKDVLAKHNLALDILRKNCQDIKLEKEKITANFENEVSQTKSQIQILESKMVEKDEKIDSLQWKKGEMEKHVEKLKVEHDDEMGEMVDVVNDLKFKEEELISIEKDMKVKTLKIDELCKQLLAQEQSHKEQMRKKESELDTDLKSMEAKVEESRTQCSYLKEQMGCLKVEGDLQVQKLKMEFEVEMNNLINSVDQKANLVDKLKDELSAKSSQLELVKEELDNTKDELDEMASDLDIKEASFNNESKEIDERHKEEVEELISKNESLCSKIGDLKETIAKRTADFDSKMDEIVKAKKLELSLMKDQVSAKELQIMDMEANIKSLEEKLHGTITSMEGEASLANAKIEKIATENETLRRSKYELENSAKNITIEKDHIIHLNEDLSIKIVEFEVQVKEMRSQYESLQMEYQKQTLDLKERSEKASLDQGSLVDLQKLLDSERARVDELQVQLNETESEREQAECGLAAAQANNAQLSAVHAQNERLRTEVAELTRKNEFLFEEIAKERLKLESRIERLAEDLEAKRKEFTIKEFEVTQLQKENTDLTSHKRQVLTLEQEKRELESQLVALAAEARMGRAARSASPAQSSQTGDEGLAMQVEFLNSVIVDMQRKLDKQAAQLELYETAGILGKLNILFVSHNAKMSCQQTFVSAWRNL